MAGNTNFDDVALICSVRSLFDGVDNETTNQYRAATNDVRKKYEMWKNRWSTCKGPWEQARLDTNGDDDEIDAEHSCNVAAVDADREAILETTKKILNGLLIDSNREANVHQVSKASYNAFNKFSRAIKNIDNKICLSLAAHVTSEQ